MNYVQLTLTTVQTDLIANAIRGVLTLEKDLPLTAVDQLVDLAAFFEDATENPRAYAPTGRMATALKIRGRRGK